MLDTQFSTPVLMKADEAFEGGMIVTTAERFEQGKDLFQSELVRDSEVPGVYKVTGRGDENYLTSTRACTCKDHEFRGATFVCKHRIAVWLQVRYNTARAAAATA